MKATKWMVFAYISFVCAVFTFYKGIDKMTRYHNGAHINAYVGGDAYNYIINGNYATAFFVLTTMFVLAGIGFLIVHYVQGIHAQLEEYLEEE